MDTTQHAGLVSSSDVNGTEVYGSDGANIGSIDHLMIDKQSGKVAYAVMGFGGFLGLGEEHHPVPWSKLRYDTAKNGFVTDITEQEVKGALRAMTIGTRTGTGKRVRMNITVRRFTGSNPI